MTDPSHSLVLEDNQRLLELVGPQDEYLRLIEKKLGIDIHLLGNTLTFSGSEPEITFAKTAVSYLYNQLHRLKELTPKDVEAAVRLATSSMEIEQSEATPINISTKRRRISPKSANQAAYIESMQQHDLVFGVGPAGTGKTYLAVAMAVSLLLEGKVERIILTRPAVEAGEKLGFLPGDMREKVDPYLRPLYDALHDLLPSDQVIKRFSTGDIEIAPLAFMRGRTLSNAFVILDEAQNCTPMQMKMFLTRLGPNSRMVVTGDVTQIDLPHGTKSGLKDALHILHNVKEIGFIFFTEMDVIRHPLVARIVHAYQNQT